MLQKGGAFPGNGQEWGIDARIELERMILDSALLPPPSGNRGRSKKYKYLYRGVLSAFDIETTSLSEIKQSFMYVWQWAFHDMQTGEWLTVYGRTWEDWRECAETVCGALGENQYIVVLDHNLSYEFQFLREYVHFSIDDVFATEPRAIVKAMAFSHLEYRCTMRHSNTSLKVYTEQWNVEHRKLSGDEYDYNKRRYPWTPLDHQELMYALHDVIGLIEAYEKELEYWHDDLYTVPMTSTGYVRRICKRAWSKINYMERLAWMTDMTITDLLREAFRGGDTHASRYHSTPEGYEKPIKISGVQSWDRASSYPDVLVNCLYPLGDWYKLQNGREWIGLEEIEKYIHKYDKAILTRVHFKALRLRDRGWPMPYIPKSKAGYYEGIVEDNGRILSANFLSMTITDPDWEIIKNEYDWDDVHFSDTYYCRYRALPAFFTDVVKMFYREKTELKGAAQGSLEEIEYTLKKQLLNALYGMAAQQPIKESVIYLDDTGEWINEIEYDIRQQEQQAGKKFSAAQRQKFTRERRQELLNKHNKKGFLPYSIGVWCTAWARLELHRSMWTVHGQGGRTIYVDTDSNKFIGAVDMGPLNDFYKSRSEKNGAFADDRKGKRHFMGVYEYEGTYKSFATMGSKKYVYEDENGLHITIAGVNKKKGAAELAALGGIDAFRSGIKFEAAGGVQGVYNDTGAGWITIDGRPLYIGSNICLLQDTYTLGLSDDYARLLDSIAVRGKIDGYTFGGNDE